MDSRLNDFINRSARLHWSTAALAGLCAGAIVWLLSHGAPWFTSGVVSPTFMGRDLKPPGVVDPLRSAVTTIAQAGLSICYGLVIAPLVFRFRAMWAVAAGALVGFVLYVLNFAVFHLAFNVNWSTAEWPALATHIAFGAFAAALYKGMASRRTAVA